MRVRGGLGPAPTVSDLTIARPRPVLVSAGHREGAAAMPPPFTPSIDNPYPENYAGQDIDEFKFLTPLVLRREIEAVKMRGGKDDAEYVVGAPYAVSYKLRGETGTRKITVPKGMLTDLASVPRAAWALVAPVGPHLEASIAHDFLYIAWQDLGREARDADRSFADNIMHAGMVEAGVDRSQIVMIYSAVRAFGGQVYRKADPPPRYVKLP